MLRPRPAAIVDARPHLHLRMHVLRRLRGEGAVQRLPELRRRLCAKTDPAGDRMAPGSFGGQTSAFEPARAALLQPRGDRRALRPDQGYSARAAVKGCYSVMAGL